MAFLTGFEVPKSEMKHLCDTCKTSCLDKAEYAATYTKVTACEYHIDEEYECPHMCERCNKPALTYTVVEGQIVEHDTCLDVLPGVISACCGHGIHEGHIKFKNGTRIRLPKQGTRFQRGTK